MSRLWLLVFMCLVTLVNCSFFEVSHDAVCQATYAKLIKDIAQKSRVKMSDTTNSLVWCSTSKRRRRAAVFENEIDLDALIAVYSTFAGINSFSGLRTSPVESYGVFIAPNNERIPVYVVADIRRRHLPRANTRPPFDDNVEDQMRLMGQLDTDERGHLLAHSLGGGSGIDNIVPMARNLNRHYDYRSYWRSNEDWIARFLRYYPRGRVTWRLLVHYDDDVILNPNAYHSLRPRAFTLQYTAYRNARDDDTVYHTTDVVTYVNDNNVFCDSLNRRRRAADANSKCVTPQPKLLTGVMGDEKSRGTWGQRYKVGFPFTIDGKHYFYSQSIILIDGHNFFIQELLPNGQMGSETDRGFLLEYYDKVFPFSIDDVQYFYGQSFDSYKWDIRELHAGGRMGNKVCSGQWKQRYQVIFPFTIDGKYFFYGQSIIDGHNWFIQELLSGGQMGNEMSHGYWNYYYPVSFPFMINGRQYFYGQSHYYKTWFIQELLPDGKMGLELSSGKWSKRYEVSFPFQFGGRYYFYGQSILDGYNWFIQELLPGGQMGRETSHGFLSEYYHLSFPYKIDGRQYFYGHSTDDKSWIIRELL